MVMRLGEALQLPLDARNQFLTQAGFAATYGNREWSHSEMAPIRQAIDTTLENHSPYPGLVLDRLWRIVQANASASTLYQAFGIGIGDSLIDLLTSENLPPFIENWPEVALVAAKRLRLESQAQGGIERFDKAVEHLMGQAGRPSSQTRSPVIPTIVKLGDTRLTMFATLAQIGTPEDIILDDLKVELYFPMDDETDRVFKSLDA